MGVARHYRDLQVWQRGMDVAVLVYKHTAVFPNSEIYGLTNQLRRAAVSIPSNIAEGFGRSNKDLARFLTIAMGSLAELETQLEIAHRVGYLDQPTHTSIKEEVAILGRQLNVFLQKVRD